MVRPGNLIILESTSPPGTTAKLAETFYGSGDLQPGDLYLAHAPERVLPGRILREVVENARIIGGHDAPSTEVCAEFYRTFVSGALHLTDARTAETAKLVENAYRDVNIAFANELSLLSDELDIDVWETIELANRHPRVEILKPGPGVGGHCIPVDPWFLVATAPESTTLIRTARGVNERKPDWILERALRHAERFKDPVIACLGLAYKPNVDDMRESPAIDIARGSKDSGKAALRVCEPYLESHDDFALVDHDTALHDADIVLILVAHDDFRRIPRKSFEEKIIIDACGLLRERDR